MEQGEKESWIICVLSTTLWLSFGLSCGGLSNHQWVYFANSTSEGLWNIKYQGGSTAGIVRLPWIDAVTSLMTIGVVFMWLAAFGLNIITGCWNKINGRRIGMTAASVSSLVAAFCLITGVAIYTAEVEAGYSGSYSWSPVLAYGVGFGLAWAGAAVGVIGSGFFLYMMWSATEDDFNSA